MKKLAVCLLSCILLASCSASLADLDTALQSDNTSSNAQQEPPEIETYTIETYAEKSKAAVGEMNKPYNFETQILGADGENQMIAGLSIVSVSYAQEFQAGDTTFKNVIAFETFGEETIVNDFRTNNSYITVADQSGAENINFTTGATCYDAANDKLYMLYSSPDDISSYEFAILGGFAPEKNSGNSKFVFEISH